MEVKVALAQFESGATVDENVQKIESAICEAASNGAHLVAFHELATTPYFCFQERNETWFSAAEPVPGPTTDRIVGLANQRQISILLPLYESHGQERYNTAVLIEPGLGIVGKYRKSHVPASAARGREGGAEENWYFSPGDTGFVAWESVTGLRIGALICYDRHHPEAQRIYGQIGIDILFVPTASYRSFITGPLWEAELMAAAFQNSYYVAGINKVGPVLYIDHDARYPGRSLFVDPEGVIIAKSGDTETLLYANVDPQRPGQVRGPLNFFKYRRPELYGSLVSQHPERRLTGT